MTDEKTINVSPAQISYFAKRVLEAILVMHDGGTSSTLDNVYERITTIKIEGMAAHEHHKIEVAFMALVNFGLIKKMTAPSGDTLYEPVPGVKKWFYSHNLGSA